jgi:histidine triad (HIT) family protein
VNSRGCIFCEVVDGSRPAHLVHETTATIAFLDQLRQPPDLAHVLVIPRAHVENIYGIDDALLGAVSATAKRVAIGLKTAYGCEGTSTRQHNEPAGNQDVWHLHVHVFPRYPGDRLYQRHEERRWATPDERAPYAAKLRAVL